MINKVIRIELISDLCAASGDGFAGVVDTDICYNDNGLPYIPSKRLKGCLRECALDILSVDDSFKYKNDFKRLFGKIGSDKSAEMTLGNGQLKDSEDFKGMSLVQNIENFTHTRTRTKMENGKASRDTLRTMRVINKGNIFEFPVTLDKNLEDFLKKCIASLRAMGLNRSRGLGEVKCTLEDAESDRKAVFAYHDLGDEAMLLYGFTLIEPVISAERSGKPYACEDYIFGSAILGAFADKYIKKYGLDEEFYNIFLKDNVIFTAAMPCVDDDVYYPAPHSLKTNKIKKDLADDSEGEFKENNEAKNPICKRLGGFVTFVGKSDKGRIIVKKLTPNKTVFLHHFRSHDKAVGKATKSDGELYSYEALSEGQSFVGKIIGSKSYIEKLKELFDDSDVLRLGRSRTAQYGKVHISAYNKLISSGSMKLNKGDTFRLVAVTPLIIENEYGINTTNLDVAKKTLADAKRLGDELRIVKSMCTETTVAGYNSKWRLPKAQQRAIAEGSVIVFEYSGDGAEITDGFIGLRTGEGFGQFMVEPVPDWDAFELYEKPATLGRVAKIVGRKSIATMGAQYGSNCENPPLNTGLHGIIAAIATNSDFNRLAELLCNIKQPQLLQTYLSFLCDKNEMYFMTDPEHLEPKHIVKLMAEHAEKLFCDRDTKEHYTLFAEYITAAANRIRQIRRINEAEEESSDE